MISSYDEYNDIIITISTNIILAQYICSTHVCKHKYIMWWCLDTPLFYLKLAIAILYPRTTGIDLVFLPS